MNLADEAQPEPRFPIWDRAVRLIHWSFPIGFGLMWWSGEQGRMDIHQWVGYSLLCLVVTRVAWGFVGSQPTLFIHFLPGPSTLVRYVREGGQYAGHNPLGALSVLVLLGLLLTQALSGTMSRDDLLFEGPFSYWAGDFSGTMTDWHEINWRLLQGFVALHLASVGWYQWRKRQPLLQAMWRGEAGYKFSPLPPKPLLLAVMILLSAAALLWALVSVAPGAPSYY